MNYQKIWQSFKRKLVDVRPFLRTKVGSRLALFGIADFILLFFAPMLHGFVGAALLGCVASVFLVIIWRKFDKDSAVVPAVFLSVPMLLDMLIYGIAYSADSDKIKAIISALLVAIAAMFIAARSKLIGFIDRNSDMMYICIAAGAVCVAAVALAWIVEIIVWLAWWILCVIAFVIVAGIFMGVVLSTAAYTATDGRRQARRRNAQREQREEEQQKKYTEYRPRRRETKIYNLDDDDFIDIE